MNKGRFPRQFVQLVSALFRDIFRQPAVLFWGIVFPILMSLGLGIAFTQQQEVFHHVAVIIPDIQRNVTPRIDSFLNEYGAATEPAGDAGMRHRISLTEDKLGKTTFTFLKTGSRKAMVLLKQGRVSLLIQERDGNIRYRFDPLNIDARLAYLKLSGLLGGNAFYGRENRNGVEPLTVMGTRYIDFLIPGLMSMGIMMSCMWGMSYGMIEKRSRKLLRRMVATPMKKSYFLMALMIVRITMNFIESGLLVLFAYLVFDISIQGSIPALILFFIAGNIAFGGIAIFVSSRTANTEIGNGLVNVVVMPMMVLSGIFFSYHNFPDWSIPFIRKLPLTILVDGIRSIFIEGAGFAETAQPTLMLSAIGILFFSAGLKIFKWH
ncbi:MAG: ABC transporter permease [Thermodesulfobacteriota bacterium]